MKWIVTVSRPGLYVKIKYERIVGVAKLPVEHLPPVISISPSRLSTNGDPMNV